MERFLWPSLWNLIVNSDTRSSIQISTDLSALNFNVNQSATSNFNCRILRTSNWVILIISTILLQCFNENSSARPSGTIGYLQQLKEEDWILRTEALHYLSENNVKESVDQILKIALDNNENSWIRSQALIAYCKIQKSSSVPEVVLAFSSSKDIIMVYWKTK